MDTLIPRKTELLVLVSLLIAAAFLAFYNLQYSPRPWQDEGAALSVSKTLVEDGVYAMRSSDGYQTFGPVLSVGPTVLLPIALSFKLFGVGLVQGRIVMAAYILITLIVFYLVGKELFESRAALIAVLLLFGSPAVHLLNHGRQVFGEIPALGFFLGGILTWARGVRTGRYWACPLTAGLLFGMAMVTKTQYILIGFGTITVLAILDLLYYRQRNIRALFITGLVAGVCVTIWWGWQRIYFGTATFQENAAKLRQLANVQFELDPHSIFMAIKFLFSPDSGYLYYSWGVPALMYIGVQCIRGTKDRSALVMLLIFSLLWFGYVCSGLFWPRYFLAPAAICALFVGKLWHDLLDRFTLSPRNLWNEIREGRASESTLKLVTLTAIGLMICYPLQSAVRTDVLAHDDDPQQVAAFLHDNVDKTAVVETWEHELNILTDQQYHFPDFSLLAKTHATVYRHRIKEYALGADYFQRYRPSYLVIGWVARQAGLYDSDFLREHSHLLVTIGSGDLRYEVYKLQLP